jgi:pimeloyl-ACP methyl ester carboxylesterase
MSHSNLLRSVSYCLSAALILAVATTGNVHAAPPDKAKGKPPLQLETYRSFFVGGERVTKPDGTVRLDGHAYVEAFIPHRPAAFKKLPPIIVTHPSLSATIWLERANGEEGWALLFARAGYPVYVVDPPGTGRAARDRDLITELSQITQSSSNNWAGWKNGPEFGQLGFNPPGDPDTTPHQFPMNQMPTDEEGVNQFLGHLMVYRINLPGVDAIVDPVRDAAYIALLEKIGEPVIWMGWSRGGLLGQRLITQRPELFKAFTPVEGCTPNLPTPQEWQAFLQTMVDHKIPFLHVNPDYARDTSGVLALGQFLPSGSRCVQPFDVAAYLRSQGVIADTIYLPDVGIYGNGHNYMLQNNADEIVDKVYLPWLKENVKVKEDDDEGDHKGRHDRKHDDGDDKRGHGGKHADDDHKRGHGSKHAER